MDQARSTISKIFNGEPHSYTRFNLTQNMEGDTSQVEMKLSEVDEETGGNGVGDHLNHNSTRKPYLTQKLGRTPKNLCFMVTATLLIFIIGYLIGYLVHQKKEVSADCSAASSFPFSEPVAHETGAAPLMEWDKVEELLSQKLSPTKFESVFSEFVKNSHRAGSYDDENLGNKVIDRFNQYGLKTWTDEHFVKVHDAPASGFNKVVFKDKSMNPSGFLSYSASGTALGPLLYAHYGRESDFKLLQGKSISLSGKVVLLRAGKISFAEKVANAAKVNASAVLIYADPTEYSIGDDTQLFGHVHLGSGDPYTPGFPSFNHTQFPPVQSSGLPAILAQTITTSMAVDILRALGGPAAPSEWGVFHKLGGDEDVNVTVNNVLVEKKIHNVFGVIKGFVDPDRYVVIGAQRDAWGPGFATSTVGTSVLVELARAISDMVKHNGFKPRRSIVFASWSAGEYGSVGVTEWLEGYLSSLSMKAFAYINLDGVVSGHNGFKVAASPLLLRIIKNALKEVTLSNKVSLYDQFSKSNWESNMMETMKMDNAAYPFLAFSGIPSVSFRFSPNTADYQHSGTLQDTQDKLNLATSNQVPQLTDAAARFAGQLVLRLVHDHLLPMDMTKYTNMIRIKVAQINGKVNKIKRMKPELLPKALTVQWLISAAGSLKRASDGLMTDIQNSDLEDIEMCRIINDRIMSVEKNLLSPYVSPSESPFRHILMGSGPHTLEALSNHLDALSTDTADADADLFHNQFARVTWTIKGSANSLAGDIWAVDNEI